jgi:tRNA threonylcarbamoyladenosine biosynthesis protein TsaE
MRRHAAANGACSLWTWCAQDTEDLGWQLASARPAGERALAVLYLAGDLGAGKTTFARGFLRGFGVKGPVRSPTYTIVEPYSAADLTLLHVDLYRLRGADELETLGLREHARAGCVWLIEWPERGAGRLPLPDLELAFAIAAHGHDVEITAHSASGRAWLQQLTGDAVEKGTATP